MTGVHNEFAAVWTHDGATFAVRDPMGVIPLYYTEINGELYFSTQFSEVVRARRGRGRLNLSYLQSLWWGFYGLLDETPIQEIRRLPPGHMLRRKAGHTHIKKYIGAPTGEAALDIRDAVERAVDERVRGPKPTALFLSGGYDSSLIAATAARLRSPPSDRFKTYSLVFSDGLSKSDDLESVLNGASWSARLVNAGSQANLFRDHLEIPYFYTPNLNFYAPLLKAAAQDGMKRVMTGLGGDDLFSFPNTLLLTLARQGSLGSLLRELSREPRAMGSAIWSGLKALAPDWIYRSTRALQKPAPGGFVLKGADRSAILEKIRSYEIERRRLRPEPHLSNLVAKFYTSGMSAFAFEQEQELAQHYGLRMSYPLVDYDVVNAVLGAGVESQSLDFTNKGLLRSAMAPVTPDRINRIVSRQSYGETVNRVMDTQREKWIRRRQLLIEREVLDQRTADNLSLNELRVVNYAYKILNYLEGALNEPNAESQKAVPEAET